MIKCPYTPQIVLNLPISPLIFIDFAAKLEKEMEQFDAATLRTCLLRNLSFADLQPAKRKSRSKEKTVRRKSAERTQSPPSARLQSPKPGPSTSGLKRRRSPRNRHHSFPLNRTVKKREGITGGRKWDHSSTPRQTSRILRNLEKLCK